MYFILRRDQPSGRVPEPAHFPPKEGQPGHGDPEQQDCHQE